LSGTGSAFVLANTKSCALAESGAKAATVDNAIVLKFMVSSQKRILSLCRT
jgi:hypothetical protein